MGRSKENERLLLPCKFGTLACEVVRQDEDYCEFAIDLYRSDGKAVQIAVIGTDEYAPFRTTFLNDAQWEQVKDENAKVHVYLYDGNSGDCEEAYYVEPFGEGWWAEETVGGAV